MRFAALFVLALAAACIEPTSPLQREGRPTILEFSTGGFGVPSRQLELRGDTVIARKRPYFLAANSPYDSVRVVPSAEEWRAFWAAADAAGVQKWRTAYNAEGVVDGDGWSIRIATGAREVSSSGSNAYPDRDGDEHELDQPPEWTAFLAALDRLAGVSGWF